jgi:hypothetical protein
MIVDKGGEEIRLKLQDLSLKILGVEIKFSSPCVRLVSIFSSFCLSGRSDQFVFIRTPVCNNSFLELGLEKIL